MAEDLLPAWCVVVVRGRSMRPGLDDGDRLLVRGGGAAARTARPGDVVVVRLPGDRPVVAVKRLAHREAGGGWWVERDSATEGVDSWQVGALAPDALLGVVRARLWPCPGPPPAGPRHAPPREDG